MGTSFLSRGYDDKSPGILKAIVKINAIKANTTVSLSVLPETSSTLVGIFHAGIRASYVCSLCPGNATMISLGSMIGTVSIRFNDTQRRVEVIGSSDLDNSFEKGNHILVLCV